MLPQLCKWLISLDHGFILSESMESACETGIGRDKFGFGPEHVDKGSIMKPPGLEVEHRTLASPPIELGFQLPAVDYGSRPSGESNPRAERTEFSPNRDGEWSQSIKA